MTPATGTGVDGGGHGLEVNDAVPNGDLQRVRGVAEGEVARRAHVIEVDGTDLDRRVGDVLCVLLHVASARSA